MRLSTYAHTAPETEDDMLLFTIHKECRAFSKKAGSKCGSNIFLTAADQRTQLQKDEKSAKDPFEFLQDIRDVDGVRLDEPRYDPRMLDVPPKAWETFSHMSSRCVRIYTGPKTHFDTPALLSFGNSADSL